MFGLGNWYVCLLLTIALLGIMGGMACSGSARAAICPWWFLLRCLRFLFPAAARRGRALAGIAVVAHGGVAVCWLGQGGSLNKWRWGAQQRAIIVIIIIIIIIVVLGGVSVATKATATVLLLPFEAQGARRRRVLRGCCCCGCSCVRCCCRCCRRRGRGGLVLLLEKLRMCGKQSGDIQVTEAGGGGGGSGRGNEMLEVGR